MTLTAPTTFDSERFDIEIEVERLGYAYFDGAQLAALLGLKRSSVRRMVATGILPRQDRIEEVDWERGGHLALWTAEQVVEMLYERRNPAPRPAPPEAPHGTEQGYGQHYRRGERGDAICWPCRQAKYEANRLRKVRQRTEASA